MDRAAAWKRVKEAEENLRSALRRAHENPSQLHTILATMSKARHDRALKHWNTCQPAEQLSKLWPEPEQPA